MGTGTSQGVPVIGYDSSGIDLSNPRTGGRVRAYMCTCLLPAKKYRSMPRRNSGCSALKNSISRADAFILTHGHADHIAGMDDLRRFCDKAEGNAIDVYSNEYGLSRVRAMFPYALGDKPTERGYPCFRLKEMPETLDMGGGLKISSASFPTGAYRRSVWSLNAAESALPIIPIASRSLRARRSSPRARTFWLWIALGLKPHPSHMTLDEALAVVEKLSPKLAFFTHTTSHIDYGKIERSLPKNCHIAYDGLTVEI